MTAATAPAEPVKTLVLPSELTHQQASACLGMLLQALRTQVQPVVVADASALAVFDSSALAVLLECRREVLARSGSFSVKGLSPGLRELATLYGVGGLLPDAP
ncbi:MAG TPA: STAS domain-containing protein [Burkholderiaceae bacterium]